MSYSEALRNLMDQYKDYNLLLPAASEAQLNPFYKYHVEVVPVDLTETSGDVFKVGSVRQVDNNGNDVYIDTYTISQ